ncbi:MAG TPA: hypothetical protein VKD72_29755 [Gemmataceae bacterium]|nr:hypothetical protein [Gemmataceae bacterium]
MAKKPEPVLLELATLPREQMGPFLMLGLEKDATKEDIEAHWAERIKWARKGQYNVALEDINWARELVSDLQKRAAADAASLNADSVDGAVARVTRRFGLTEGRSGPTWEALDEEKPLAEYCLPIEVPSAESVRSVLVVPEVPQEVPGVAKLLDQLAQAPVDPWTVPL